MQAQEPKASLGSIARPQLEIRTGDSHFWVSVHSTTSTCPCPGDSVATCLLAWSHSCTVPAAALLPATAIICEAVCLHPLGTGRGSPMTLMGPAQRAYNTRL